MGKKKNLTAAASASAANSTISRDIHDLKSLTSDLVKEVAELRNEIEHLRSRLDSLIPNGNIPESSDGDVVLGHLPVAEVCTDAQITEDTNEEESASAEVNEMDRHIPDSSYRNVLSLLPAAETRSNSEIAEATEMPASAELNAMEIVVLPLLKEQDAVERDNELVIEGSDITRDGKKAKDEKIRKKNWIFYPIAITAIFLVSTVVVSFCNSFKFKK